MVLLTTLAAQACSKEFEYSGAPGFGAEHVKNQQKLCPEGDMQKENLFTGSYQWSQKKPTWFAWPRANNKIRDGLKWEASSTLEGPLVMEHDLGALTVTLDGQEFTGSLFNDGRFCFYGPIELPIETEGGPAYLFGQGNFNDQSPDEFTGVLHIGITIGDEEEASQEVKVQIQMSGKRSGEATTGALVSLKRNNQEAVHVYVGDEVQFDGTSLLVERQLERPDSELPAIVWMSVQPSAADKHDAEIEIELDNDETLKLTQCHFKQDGQQGSFTCNKDGLSLYGHFSIKS